MPLLAAVTAPVVAAVVGAAFLLGRPAPVEVRPAPSAADPACTALAAELPATVASQRRRETSSRSPGVAAWGDPPVVWLCGTPEPDPSPDCITVSGVDWVFRRLDDGTAFTTYGRDPAVQVLVPSAYAPEPLRLAAFSAVVAALPQGRHRCS